ncbi:RdgB/HAM1 family non-canonical purine NTP pyrophosphatase [Alkalinema pantanalense CENA528]|uniref:RdgB/HAM1 family non-canonical purine NTP pyrophosphatase n=1 Tax=Alkalinema pantanalense TaxID=1620705 RepID=UPI003D6ED4C2
MTVLVVATGNPGKLQEIQAYFSEDSGWELELKPPELDVEETGVTFLENACLKASQVALATGHWAIADDSGLAVDGLQGAPGVFSARYGTSDDDRIDRVLRELGSTTERRAQFICALAVARPDGTIVIQEEGICPGEILSERRGEGGFGYDPIFFVPEIQKTFAEMSPEVKHRLSHRGRAFEQVLPQLAQLQGQL